LFHADRRTDRRRDIQTNMTKLIVTVRNFANAPKKRPPEKIFIDEDNKIIPNSGNIFHLTPSSRYSTIILAAVLRGRLSH
jgi:hypothetical protein